MQMFLDTIADTTFKIDTALSVERNKISKYLKEHLPTNFKLEEWENEIDILSLDDSDNRLLASDLDITYSTTINKVTKRDVIENFTLYLGYTSNKRKNVVFIHIFDISAPVIITDIFVSSIKESISQEWICYCDDEYEENNICIEFPIDDTFSIEKIERCMQTFREYILQPIIAKLEQ